MTDPAVPPTAPAYAPPAGQPWPAAPRGGGPSRWVQRGELRAAAYLVGAMALAGALLGVIWQWWSPPSPLGFVLAPHAIQVDETEAWMAADGRFAVLCGAAGLLAGVAMWLNRASRGPLIAAALVAGGLAGSVLTALVGHVLAGGTDTGPTNTVLRHLPLSVHMHGLLVIESALAVLAYSLCAAFATDDDLGRPEPGSVRLDEQPQHGWGYGDGAGALHQPYLPPQ